MLKDEALHVVVVVDPIMEGFKTLTRAFAKKCLHLKILNFKDDFNGCMTKQKCIGLEVLRSKNASPSSHSKQTTNFLHIKMKTQA
jgi:hypothetical protein